MEKVLARDEIVKVMNEWMRRYTKEPDRFSREFEAVNLFLSEESKGQEPSYGERCAAYMMKLNAELQQKEA